MCWRRAEACASDDALGAYPRSSTSAAALRWYAAKMRRLGRLAEAEGGAHVRTEEIPEH